jgi:hypothetical protein
MSAINLAEVGFCAAQELKDGSVNGFSLYTGTKLG